MICNRKQRNDRAGQCQHRDNLNDVGVRVSVRRDRILVEESGEKMPNESFESFVHTHRQAPWLIASAMSFATASISSCWTSWVKISSSEGRCIRSRRRITLSSALISPL